MRAINNEPDYTKAGNYWRWLKKKLAARGIQPVSDTHEFKLAGPDGKRRVTDVMDDNGVLLLAKHYPNNRANEFLDWFTYSDNTIDGQSKKKAYKEPEKAVGHHAVFANFSDNSTLPPIIGATDKPCGEGVPEIVI